MKVCIPTQSNIGKQARVHEHFGSAPHFTIYDMEQDICEIVDNADKHHSHGMCQPLSVLQGKTINAVVCSGMGKRAIQKLNDAGIRVYRASGPTVEDIVRECRESKLEEITVENACARHGCHH